MEMKLMVDICLNIDSNIYPEGSNSWFLFFLTVCPLISRYTSSWWVVISFEKRTFPGLQGVLKGYTLFSGVICIESRSAVAHDTCVSFNIIAKALWQQGLAVREPGYGASWWNLSSSVFAAKIIFVRLSLTHVATRYLFWYWHPYFLEENQVMKTNICTLQKNCFRWHKLLTRETVNRCW